MPRVRYAAQMADQWRLATSKKGGRNRFAFAGVPFCLTQGGCEYIS